MTNLNPSPATRFQPGNPGRPKGTAAGTATSAAKLKRAMFGVRHLANVLQMPHSFQGTPREFIEAVMRNPLVDDTIRLAAARSLDRLPPSEKKFSLSGYIEGVAVDAEAAPANDAAHANGHANGFTEALAALSPPPVPRDRSPDSGRPKRPVATPDGRFDSIAAAAKHYEVSHEVARLRAKNGWMGWRLVEGGATVEPTPAPAVRPHGRPILTTPRPAPGD
jgi:hypothetical protein